MTAVATVPDEPDIVAETMELTVAGRPLPARVFRAQVPANAANAASVPALVIVPALGTPAGVYRRFASAVAARGVNVLLADLRGIGDSPFRASRRTDWGYVDLADEELERMIAAAANAFPGAPLFLLGHSLGAQLALLHASRRTALPPLSGLIFCAAGSPYWKTFRGWRRWQVRGFVSLVRLWSLLFGQFHGELFGFGGHQPSTLMREWAGFCRSGVLRELDGTRLSDAFAQVCLPVLGIDLAGDQLAPSASMDALLAMSGGNPQRWKLDRLPDGALPGHFGWLKQPEPVADRVAAFVHALD